MRLMTTVLTRRDGTVILRGQNGKSYVFKAEQVGGDLVCDVDDEDTIASALLTGSFEPVDAEDQAQAADLLMSLGGSEADADPDAPGEGSEDLDDDETDPEALPEEANTPPAAKPAAKPRAKRGT
jgi:hypothetical protein